MNTTNGTEKVFKIMLEENIPEIENWSCQLWIGHILLLKIKNSNQVKILSYILFIRDIQKNKRKAIEDNQNKEKAGMTTLTSYKGKSVQKKEGVVL